MVVLQSAAGCWVEPAVQELQQLVGLALSKVLACHRTAEELEAILGLELDWQLVGASPVSPSQSAIHQSVPDPHRDPETHVLQ